MVFLVVVGLRPYVLSTCQLGATFLDVFLVLARRPPHFRTSNSTLNPSHALISLVFLSVISLSHLHRRQFYAFRDLRD